MVINDFIDLFYNLDVLIKSNEGLLGSLIRFTSKVVMSQKLVVYGRARKAFNFIKLKALLRHFLVLAR